jgi:cysteine synthase
MARYENILETIGNTPLVKLGKLAPAGVNVYVKIESRNPMGSVKDRMARAIIERAEATGALKPGQTVIEATSGNTGIGLAMVCAQKGYPLVVTMAESFSVERRKLLRFLGAKVVLTPASEKGSGMLAKAVELAETHGWYLCRQFENEANADVHTRTTAQEILADFAGERLDYWVSGFGTGGTLKGVARALKQASPVTRVIAAEPDNAPVLASGIPQPRDANGKPTQSHPNFRPHLMQGWAPDFISKLTEDAVAAGLVDEIVPVAGNDALQLARDLARREGIFVGTSSGATLAAALTIARRSKPGTNIVCMLPDTGERYLSTPLFADIGEEMTTEELTLSRSTPSCRFDVPAPAQPAAAVVVPAALDPEAERFFDHVVQHEPVVMFALEWCEFSWSVSSAGPCASCSRGSAFPIAVSTSTRSRFRPVISAARSAPCSARARTPRQFRRSSSAARM